MAYDILSRELPGHSQATTNSNLIFLPLSNHVCPTTSLKTLAAFTAQQTWFATLATREQVALGKKIFHGEVAGATCAGCHGTEGIGTPVGADLTSGTWLWGDGSLAAITETIKNGVLEPKQHPGAMPPMGGVELSDENLKAVAAYVWSLGHMGEN